MQECGLLMRKDHGFYTKKLDNLASGTPHFCQKKSQREALRVLFSHICVPKVQQGVYLKSTEEAKKARSAL